MTKLCEDQSCVCSSVKWQGGSEVYLNCVIYRGFKMVSRIVLTEIKCECVGKMGVCSRQGLVGA